MNRPTAALARIGNGDGVGVLNTSPIRADEGRGSAVCEGVRESFVDFVLVGLGV